MPPQSSPIPAFYRIWFAWCDVVLAAATAVATFLYPDVVLDTYVPESLSPYNPHQAPVMHALAGSFAMVAILAAALLRRSRDVVVWKILQASILAMDVSGLVSFCLAMRRQGKLDRPEAWRREDWFTLVVTLWVAVLRVAFLADVGMKKAVSVRGDRKVR